MIWTSKWRIPRTRLPVSRTTANASGRSWSSVSPFSRRALNSSVFARSSSSERAETAGSSAFTRSAVRRSFTSSRSFPSNRVLRKAIQSYNRSPGRTVPPEAQRLRSAAEAAPPSYRKRPGTLPAQRVLDRRVDDVRRARPKQLPGGDERVARALEGGDDLRQHGDGRLAPAVKEQDLRDRGARDDVVAQRRGGDGAPVPRVVAPQHGVEPRRLRRPPGGDGIAALRGPEPAPLRRVGRDAGEGRGSFGQFARHGGVAQLVEIGMGQRVVCDLVAVRRDRPCEVRILLGVAPDQEERRADVRVAQRLEQQRGDDRVRPVVACQGYGTVAGRAGSPC